MRRIILFSAVLLTCLSPVGAQKMKFLKKEVVAEAESNISAAMAESKIPGLSVEGGTGGEVVWSKGYGRAKVELGAPVTTST
jgi:CubicO group peptidase (beta-lactamase class C family)